jgi:hypothetical protein
MALVHEHVEVALGLEAGRQGQLDLRNIFLDVANLLTVLLAAEFMDQRAEEPGRRAVELGDQVRAALGAVDGFLDALCAAPPLMSLEKSIMG